MPTCGPSHSISKASVRAPGGRHGLQKLLAVFTNEGAAIRSTCHQRSALSGKAPEDKASIVVCVPEVGWSTFVLLPLLGKQQIISGLAPNLCGGGVILRSE